MQIYFILLLFYIDTNSIFYYIHLHFLHYPKFYSSCITLPIFSCLSKKTQKTHLVGLFRKKPRFFWTLLSPRADLHPSVNLVVHLLRLHAISKHLHEMCIIFRMFLTSSDLESLTFWTRIYHTSFSCLFAVPYFFPTVFCFWVESVWDRCARPMMQPVRMAA